MTHDERETALHRLLEKLGESSGILLELRDYLEALDAYYDATTTELRRRGVMLLRAAAVIGVGSVIALAITAAQVRSVERAASAADASAQNAARAAARNTVAIRVGCKLIVDLIVDAGAGDVGRDRPSDVAKLQRQLNALLVRAITARVLTSSERARARRLAVAIARGGALVQTPDCAAIAKHPERVLTSSRRRTP